MNVERTFDVMGVEFRLARIDEPLTDENGASCYTVADFEQHVLWIWNETPADLRESAIIEGVGFIWRRVLADPSLLDLPSVD
jgi:hypothetical protein